MIKHNKTLIGALEDTADRIGKSVDSIAAALGGRNVLKELPVYTKAISEPREQILVCYTVGILKFVLGPKKERYGILDMGLYTVQGELNGRYRVVWQPLTNVDPNEIFTRPPLYTGPWDK